MLLPSHEPLLSPCLDHVTLTAGLLSGFCWQHPADGASAAPGTKASRKGEAGLTHTGLRRTVRADLHKAQGKAGMLEGLVALLTLSPP